MALGVEDVGWIAQCSSAKFQIHGAPSPRTTRRSALSKPRRSASRRDAPGEGRGLGVGIAGGDGFDGGWRSRGRARDGRRCCADHTTASLASRVLALPSGCLPWRLNLGLARRTPVRRGRGRGWGHRTARVRHALRRRRRARGVPPYVRATRRSSPRSWSWPRRSMRSAAGDRKLSSTPSARSRGLSRCDDRSGTRRAPASGGRGRW